MAVLRSMGVEKVLSVDAFDVEAMEKALTVCTSYRGTAVLIAKGECVFISSHSIFDGTEDSIVEGHQ